MNISMNCLKAVVAAAVVTTVAAALAQPGPGGGRGMGMFGGGRLNDPTLLLAAEPVQKELELSDEQKTKVGNLADDARQARRDIFSSGASPDEMQTKMQDLAKENKKKAENILLPNQIQRLEEINLQVAGAGALSRPEVAEKLGLSDDQKSKLQDLADAAQQKRADLFSAGPPADQQEMQDRMQKIQQIGSDQKEKAMAVLTADQKETLEKMMGKKFEFDPMQMFPRGGFGRGGGFGAGGQGGPGGQGGK